MIGVFEEAKRLEDARLSRMAQRAQKTLDARRDFALAVVSRSGIDAGMLRFAEVLCGQPVLEEDGAPSLLSSARSLALTHGDARRMAEQAGMDLSLSLPSEALRGRRLILFGQLDALDRDALDAVDVVLIKTDATMAFAQDERAWMASQAAKWHGTERFFAWIDRIDRLNGPEEQDQVAEIGRQALGRYGFPDRIALSADGAACQARAMLSDGAALGALRGRQVALNYMMDMKAYIDERVGRALVEAGEMERALDVIERQRRFLAAAGESAAENTVYNALAEIKLNLLDALGKYAGQALANCLAEIRASKDLARTYEGIVRYVEHIWSHFLDEAHRQADREMDLISARLMEVMEVDAGALLGHMDEGARAVLVRAMKLDPEEMDGLENPLAHEPHTIAKEMRNIMLLSMPGPLATSALVVAAPPGPPLYPGFSCKGGKEHQRAAMAAAVEDYFKQARQTLADFLSPTIDRVAATVRENVKSAYAGLTDRLKRAVDGYREQLQREAARSEQLAAFRDGPLAAEISALQTKQKEDA